MKLQRRHWSLLFFPLVCLILGSAISWVVHWQNDWNWRVLQQRISRFELGMVCSLAKGPEPRRLGSSDTPHSKREEFELLAERLGIPNIQLLQSPIQRSQSQVQFSEPIVDWYNEPDGFRRVQVSQQLPESNTPFNLAILTRRYSPQEKPHVAWAWYLPIAGFLLGSAIGVRVYRNSNSREQCIQSLRAMRTHEGEIAQESLRLRSTMPWGMPKDVYQEFIASIESFAGETLTVKNNAEQSEQVLSAMPVGILAFGPDLKLTFINRAGNDLLELANRSRSGMRLVELIRQPRVIELIVESQNSKQTLDAELEVSGGKTILRLRAYPLPIELINLNKIQQQVAMLLIVSDETRLRQLENARRDFTANVSHELKTPLSAIKAYSETLLMGALDDPGANRRFVERIGEQASRLDQLIRDLLQLTRIQSQPDKIEMSSIGVLDIVRTCVEEHQTIGKNKQISVSSSVSDASLRVLAEYEAMRTILGNLLSNAVRYSEPGGQVTVKSTSDKSTVSITVEDTGIGIPIEDIDRIFERFYRVDKARSQDAGGTGLGLAIVKHLALALGGQVTVKSEPGKGSAFTLRLKRAV